MRCAIVLRFSKLSSILEENESSSRRKARLESIFSLGSDLKEIIPFKEDSDYGTTVMGDAWFGSVRAVTQLSKRSMDSIFQVKSNHGLFPKDFTKEALKDHFLYYTVRT